MLLKIHNAQNGEEVLIDDSDSSELSRYRWLILRQKRDGYTKKYVYAITGYDKVDKTKNTKIYLHRHLLKPQNHLQIDHINGNSLDNTRANLRIVTISENQKNRRHGRKPFGKSYYS